jgi:hypothetical protein
MSWLQRGWLQVALIGLAVCVTYAITLDAPFYLDDYATITENLAIRHFSNLHTILNYTPERAFGFLTLAVDYQLHGAAPAGYHFTNILIHFLAGFAVWTLLTGLLRSPTAGRVDPDNKLRWLAFVVALIFVLHPLQTQAVTYVVQRYASLAALLYIGSLSCYTWGRLKSSAVLYAGAVILAALAFFTKQNTMTLPLAAVLVELIFFRALTHRQIALVLASAVLGAVVVLLAINNIDALDRVTRETTDITRSDYFATQAEVLWHYVRLFFAPFGLRMEYDIPLQSGFGNPLVLLALAGHALVIGFAFLLWGRMPFVAFGILFFYLAHAVESSVFPIRDLAFEHRMYLPLFGLATASSAGAMRLASRWAVPVPARAAALSAVVLLLGTLTVIRNEEWRHPLELLKADTQLSPKSERAWTSYAKELMRRGMFKEALPALAAALNLGRTKDGLEVAPQTLLNGILALYYTGQPRKAALLESWLPEDVLSPVERSRLHEVKGLWLLQTNRLDEARENLDLAAGLYPNGMADAGLAAIELREGDPEAARAKARKALVEDPNNAIARRVLEKAGAPQPGTQ